MSHYWLVHVMIGISAGSLFAAAGDKHTFELKWRDRGTSDNIQVPLNHQEPFAQEPDFGQREVLRGVLQCMGQEKDDCRVNFILDKTEHKLYVDLNRDGNLANDPNGILESRGDGGNNYDFPAFPLTFTTEEGTFRYQLSANFWDYSWRQELTVQVESDYEGKIELYGNKWYLSVNDRLRGQIKNNDLFSLGPTMTPALGSMPVGYETNNISYLRLPENLFLDGHCYTVDFEFRKTANNYPALWCTLMEKEVPLGKLRIESKSVNQLVFGDNNILVLPPLVNQAIPVPEGVFFVKACHLKHDENKPEISPQRFNNTTVLVKQECENIFKIGAPLQNSIRIERAGSILKMYYELKGSGGETYDAQQITNYDNKNKPSVAIYKGDMKLADGQFEFG